MNDWDSRTNELSEGPWWVALGELVMLALVGIIIVWGVLSIVTSL